MTAPVEIAVLIRQLRAGPGKPATAVLGPCERAALATALALRDQAGGRATVFAMGPAGSEDRALALALAAGCDAGVAIEYDGAERIDYLGTATCLAEAVQRAHGDAPPFDLILAGERSVDERRGAIGPAVAELLGLPHLPAVSGVTVEDEPRRSAVCSYRRGGVTRRVRVGLPVMLCVAGIEAEPPALAALPGGAPGPGSASDAGADARGSHGADDSAPAELPEPPPGAIWRVTVDALGLDPRALAHRERFAGAVKPRHRRRRAAMLASPRALIERLVEERLIE